MPFVDISQFNSDETEDVLLRLREAFSSCPIKLQVVPASVGQEFKRYYPPILTLISPGLELPEYSTERDMERHLNKQFCTLLAGLLRHYEEEPTTPIPDRITVDVESDNESVHFRMDCWVEPVESK